MITITTSIYRVNKPSPGGPSWVVNDFAEDLDDLFIEHNRSGKLIVTISTWQVDHQVEIEINGMYGDSKHPSQEWDIALLKLFKRHKIEKLVTRIQDNTWKGA